MSMRHDDHHEVVGLLVFSGIRHGNIHSWLVRPGHSPGFVATGHRLLDRERCRDEPHPAVHQTSTRDGK